MRRNKDICRSCPHLFAGRAGPDAYDSVSCSLYLKPSNEANMLGNGWVRFPDARRGSPGLLASWRLFLGRHVDWFQMRHCDNPTYDTLRRLSEL